MTEPRTFDDPELQAEYDEARASGIEYRCGTCGERQWWYGYTCVSCGDRFTLSQVPIDAAGRSGGEG